MADGKSVTGAYILRSIEGMMAIDDADSSCIFELCILFYNTLLSD